MTEQAFSQSGPQAPEIQDLNGTRFSQGSAHRGFAAMSPEQQRQIASKGGAAVSRNREHMAEIGKKGGDVVSQNRKHMSEIGRKGGEASRISRNHA